VRIERPIALALAVSSGFAQEPPAATFGTTVVVSGGLRGAIYHIRPGSNRLPDFARLKPVGVIYASSLNVPPQSFRDGFPGVTKRFEWFAIDYTGRFWIEKPGEYRFSLTSDDGAKLWIDDGVVIDNDGQHPPIEASGSATLEHGVHRIRIAYFQGPRFEVALVLKVAPPGEDLRVFRTDDFRPPPDQWTDADAQAAAIDNDFVRVTRRTVEPHEPSQNDAFNRAIVFLDKSKVEIGARARNFDAGQVAWIAAGASLQNAGRKPARLVEIALKKPGPVTPPVRARELDPVLIDPKHNKLLFENDQVRVFRSWREPGGTEKLHEHVGAGRVAVSLPEGDVNWSGPLKHAVTNDGTQKMEMIVVEVK